MKERVSRLAMPNRNPRSRLPHNTAASRQACVVVDEAIVGASLFQRDTPTLTSGRCRRLLVAGAESQLHIRAMLQRAPLTWCCSKAPLMRSSVVRDEVICLNI